MMGLVGYLDLLIPRGGAGLIRAVVENARVPVIETGVGNCHVYVDKSADVDMAAEIIFNAKTSRPSVCNAIETILVHEKIAGKALPAIAARLREKQVELRGDDRTRAILPEAVPASEADWETEYLDYILAVRVVDSLDEAVAHIARYSSGAQRVHRDARPARGGSVHGPRRFGGRVRERLPRASRTAGRWASARKSASRRRSCTRAARWASTRSSPTSM